jgi:hypothetical protein
VVDGDRRGLGLAAEMRIGPDLPVAPGYRDLLSFLPPGEYDTLLRGAGYIPAEYEHLADTGTEDPLLLEWARGWQPIALMMASGRRWLTAEAQLRKQYPPPLTPARPVTPT